MTQLIHNNYGLKTSVPLGKGWWRGFISQLDSNQWLAAAQGSELWRRTLRLSLADQDQLIMSSMNGDVGREALKLGVCCFCSGLVSLWHEAVNWGLQPCLWMSLTVESWGVQGVEERDMAGILRTKGRGRKCSRLPLTAGLEGEISSQDSWEGGNSCPESLVTCKLRICASVILA